jgi:hypothetical protein
MTSTTRSERLQQYTEAAQLLNSAIKHGKDLAALAKLDDTQLWAIFNKKFISPTANAKAAIIVAAATLNRIANLLPDQDITLALDQANADALTVRDRALEKKAIIPSGELTEKLGITRQALSKAVHDKRIFCVEVGGQNYYPAFYGDPALERRQVERTAKALGDLLGWQKWQFFITPKASLEGLTPLEALKKGKIENVVKAAYSFAES